MTFARWAIGLALALPLAGCAPPPPPDETARETEAVVPEGDDPAVTVRMEGGVFRETDPEGRPILEVEYESATAGLGTASGEQLGRMVDARVQLFRAGEPDLVVTTPEALWREGTLSVEQNVRADTADGRHRLEGDRGDWEAATSLLTLERARARTVTEGREEIRAEGPRLEYRGGVVTLPNGGRAWRPAEGSSLRGGRVEWQLRTGQVNVSREAVFTSADGEARAGRVAWNTRANTARAEGQVVFASEDGEARAQRIDWDAAAGTVRAQGEVVFNGKDGSQLRARDVVWNVRTAEVSASGGVAFANSEGGSVRADEVVWQLRRERLVATGNVRLASPDGEATGQRLEADTGLKNVTLTGSATPEQAAAGGWLARLRGSNS